MKKKKATYNEKSRQDISSENHNVPYSTLLELAKVEIFTSPPTIITLENGRVIVNANEANDKQCSKPINKLGSEKKKFVTKKKVNKSKKKN